MGGVGGVGEQTNETAREKERAAPGALRRRKDRDRQTEREREREATHTHTMQEQRTTDGLCSSGNMFGLKGKESVQHHKCKSANCPLLRLGN